MNNPRLLLRTCGLVLALLMLAACGGEGEPTATATATPVPPTATPIPPTDTPVPADLEVPPDEIVIEHHNLFPEGIEYDTVRKRFLLGSMTQGVIYEVADDGTLSPFIDDEASFMAVGIEIDPINNRLLVAKTSPSEEQGMLGAYDLETGERIFLADLTDLYPSDTHIANDVAVDMNGIAYVTDSNAPVIYRVDMQGKASILIEDETLESINGIVAHQDGYLILGAYPGQLLKIPLGEPELIQVELPDNVEYEITDGMIMHPDGSLIMVTFPNSKIYRLSSDDEWATAKRVAMSSGHHLGFATTVALRGDGVYAIYSHLDRWTANQTQDTFEIVQVGFDAD